MSRRRRSGDVRGAGEGLASLPPEDLGPVMSFDGTDLAVRAAGAAGRPVLVFAHGFSLDMTTWHHQWTALSQSYRCVLFDQRAHGRSGRPPSGDYSVSAMGRDLMAVLDATVPGRPVVLVGHSMGAMTILAMAGHEPERFGSRAAGVVLVGASASNLLRGALWSAGARLQGSVLPRLPTALQTARRLDGLRRHASPGGIGRLIARLTNFGPEADPAAIDYVAALSAGAPIRVWTDGLARLVDTDLRHAGRYVTCPSVVVVGSEDRVTPVSAAQALTELLPAARLEVLEGAGHMTMMERSEEFNRVVVGLADSVTLGPRKRIATKSARREIEQ